MHDPSLLIASIKLVDLDIWHDEPGSRDSGEICRYPPRGLARAWWTLRHWRHLHLRFWPYLRVKRWITDRCADCGRRFLWRDARHGYQGSDAVYHDVCMSLRHVRGQLEDLTAYVRFEADDNAKWRVEQRLSQFTTT